MKSLLFTGASGFLGSNIIRPLEANGYDVVTVGITPQDNYFFDLSINVPKFGYAFDIVLHAAGKAHIVPKTKKEEQQFFDVNLQGTKNLCAALEQSGLPHSFVFISTVAVYGCETGENITEEHPLNGNTPYALSKIQAENYLIDWAKKNNVILTILRPSLIAGKNPSGNLGAMINGIITGKYLNIGGGKARKSILMADDIVTLIAKSASLGGIYNVCDDHHPSFHELEQLISEQIGVKRPKSIPYFIAKSLAVIGDLLGTKAPINSAKLDKIVKSLTFSNEKARSKLKWQPIDVLSNFKIS